MEHLVFNKEKMEFRYGSGMTVYTETLTSGRLICTEYSASGMPQLDNAGAWAFPVCAFELVIDGKDASFGWTFTDWQAGTAPDGRPQADLILTNEALSVQLTIRTLCGDNGYLSRQMYLKNLSAHKISVTRAAPLTGVLWEQPYDAKDYMDDYDFLPYRVGGFKDNHWTTEGNFDWRDIPCNTTLEFGNCTGHSGHSHPFAIVHNRIMGGYFVCQLEWSANWAFRFHTDFNNIGPGGMVHLRLKFSLAPTEMAPMRVIGPDEELKLPCIHFGYVYTDLDGAVQGLHEYQRKYLLAKASGGYDLIGYNNWGYMEHRQTEARLLREVELAAEVGAEIFTIDAGWYGKAGSAWNVVSGDWQTCSLENDLYPVISKAKELGLKVGLWVEPEAIGRDSELLKAHPEWVMQRYGGPVERSLDLTNPEVEAFIEDQLVGLIERYGLNLLRLDYNNNPYEGGFTANGDYQENTHWRHVEAIHRIFDHIRQRFPDLYLENCAAGGGRTDLGMMSRFSKTQLTDWGQFPRVARIFNGMTYCLPPEKLMIWYGVNMHSSRYGGNELQMQMMMQGIPQISGIAPCEENVNPALMQRLKEYITLYKEFIRPIQSKVKLYHHTPVIPGLNGRGWAVMEAMLPDGSKGYANVVRLPKCSEDTWTLKLRGLNCAKDYLITFVSGNKKIKANGFTLASQGIPIRLDGPLTSQMLLIEAENA